MRLSGGRFWLSMINYEPFVSKFPNFNPPPWLSSPVHLRMFRFVSAASYAVLGVDSIPPSSLLAAVILSLFSFLFFEMLFFFHFSLYLLPPLPSPRLVLRWRVGGGGWGVRGGYAHLLTPARNILANFISPQSSRTVANFGCQTLRILQISGRCWGNQCM